MLAACPGSHPGAPVQVQFQIHVVGAGVEPLGDGGDPPPPPPAVCVTGALSPGLKIRMETLTLLGGASGTAAPSGGGATTAGTSIGSSSGTSAARSSGFACGRAGASSAACTGSAGAGSGSATGGSGMTGSSAAVAPFSDTPSLLPVAFSG